MPQSHCAPSPSHDGHAARPPHPRIERFKNGCRRTVLFLGDPEKKLMHWSGELKCSVPCFRPALCPFCVDPKFTRSEREEGFSPTMVLNERSRQWEQAVCVLTKGGLGQLEKSGPAPFRGRRFVITKSARSGRVNPMDVKELDSLPDDFPALPPAFSTRAVMLRVWFPYADHPEPIQWIEPIRAERRASAVVTTPTMELDSEAAVVLASQLRHRGLKNLARHVTAAPASGEPTTPAAAEPPAPRAAAPSAADIRLRLETARREELKRRNELQALPAEELSADMALDASRTFDYLLNGVPAANGARKGGAK